MSDTLNREFTVKLASGREVTAEVEVKLVHDGNYGADADGNRGMAMDFLDDVYLSIPITDKSWANDENGPFSEAEKKEAEELLIKAAEDHDWVDDMRDSEPDYEPDCDPKEKASERCLYEYEADEPDPAD